MSKEAIILNSLAIGGYRSFGKDIQRFEKFRKINLFIGQNNCGKSNILKLICDVYPSIQSQQTAKLEDVDRHLPDGAPFAIGTSLSLEKYEEGFREFNNFIQPRFKRPSSFSEFAGSILGIFQNKAKIDSSTNVWFEYGEGADLITKSWEEILLAINQHQLQRIWYELTNITGGSLDQWIHQTIKSFAKNLDQVKPIMIPAIRFVSKDIGEEDDFSGRDIINKLALLQNPTHSQQEDKKKFEQINHFLQLVTDNRTAQIEIPHDRSTITIHIDGKTLPIESMGSGIHEVVILAAAATVSDDKVICMEEPELHLNPILQKKLALYLSENTNNQYFISTHSAALMDTPGAEIYHINLHEGRSRVCRVTSDKQRSAVCEDLGYSPSDLLQSNCVIWVEGPSDRIYINHWISGVCDGLIEGIHYSIMFYGGRLAYHLSGNDLDTSDLLEGFISLRRMNRRGVIVIDSDMKAANSNLNETKTRLEQEFGSGPGYAWITEGREIENYLPKDQLTEAIKETYPSASPKSAFRKYDNNLEVVTKGKKITQAPKVAVAKYIVANFESDYECLDLKERIIQLVNFIESSNPGVVVKMKHS